MPHADRSSSATVGCLGCHIAQEHGEGCEHRAWCAWRSRDDFPLERNFGFNLTGVGTKTNPNWIYNWVKNPKNYDAKAPMPSLRLSDQEAADITAYLMTLQKPAFHQRADPPARSAGRSRSRQGLSHQHDDDRRRRGEAASAWRCSEQLLYLGQRSIEKYGCYSCHNINGFEGLKPIGTELTIEGSKTLHLFDFGFFGDSTHTHEYEHDDGSNEHVMHTVPSWIYNKVRSPRVYDDRRTKPYNDKLKMPNFHLSRDEAELITSVVLGLTKEKVAANRMAARTPRHADGRGGAEAHLAAQLPRVSRRRIGHGRAIALDDRRRRISCRPISRPRGAARSRRSSSTSSKTRRS